MDSTRPKHRWIDTPAPPAARYDDLWFLNPWVGWAINSNGQILKTEDGGAHWRQQAHFPEAMLRCMIMASARVGWVGGGIRRGRNGPPEPFIATTIDGGRSWQSVTNLPSSYRGQFLADAPSLICGVWALPDEKHVFAAGSNFPHRPRRFLKSTDGGKSWLVRDMDDHAALLVDVYFENELQGWVVGGRSPLPTYSRADVMPMILRTEDGGSTWIDVLGDEFDRPQGEWCWKIQFVDRDFVVVSCQSYDAASILISEDGGRHWRRHEIRDASGSLVNANIEGVGFMDRSTGWVGGWGDAMARSGRTSMTADGGKTWRDETKTWPRLEPGQRNPQLPPIAEGQYVNRFRCVGDPLVAVYASGNTVYKYTDQPVYDPPARELEGRSFVTVEDSLFVGEGGVVQIPLDLPAGVHRLTVHCFDRFAGWIRTLLEEENPAAGPSTVTWNLSDRNAAPVPPGQYVVRVTCDGQSESCLIFCDPGPHPARARPLVPAAAQTPAPKKTAAARVAGDPRARLDLPYRLHEERYDD
jgi:photosystem II stability/assembly factor-like uncharacterized protein